MAETPSGSTSSGRGQTPPTETSKAKVAPKKPRAKSETATVTDDLTGKFLRVGNKLYRTTDDKTPIVRIAGDRLKTSNIDALPDIIRIAKANGWTWIKVNGGDQFKKAAYLAAAAQGLVAQTISITRAKYPDDPVKAAKEVEARRQKVALRIANGEEIAVIQVWDQQTQRNREITQEQALQRNGRSR